MFRGERPPSRKNPLGAKPERESGSTPGFTEQVTIGHHWGPGKSLRGKDPRELMAPVEVITKWSLGYNLALSAAFNGVSNFVVWPLR